MAHSTREGASQTHAEGRWRDARITASRRSNAKHGSSRRKRKRPNAEPLKRQPHWRPKAGQLGTKPRPSRGRPIATDAEPALDRELNARIDTLCEEGREYWHRFDAEVRQDDWHPFVPADYDAVRAALVSLRKPGRRFLEWGSATGVITIMADLLGFDACGIELDSSLVDVGRDLATRSHSNARFSTGSFIPMGWEWKHSGGNGRHGTIGQGASGYLELGHALDDFDVVYGFPWMGEEPMMLDLMRDHGGEDAHLVLHTAQDGTMTYRSGKIV
jgi:hypothetical protein